MVLGSDADCNSDFGAVYEADGSFTGLDIAGSWRVENGYLIETVVQGPAAEGQQGPRQFRYRLKWLSPDVVNLVEPNGEARGLVRCPAPSQSRR